MKNTIRTLGIITLVTVLGLLMAGCDNSLSSNGGSNGGISVDGTWVGIQVENGVSYTTKIIANNGSWIKHVDWVWIAMDVSRGTYSVSGNIVTFTISEVYGPAIGGTDGWIPYSNLPNEFKQLTPQTSHGTISGNKFTNHQEGITYTKQ